MENNNTRSHREFGADMVGSRQGENVCPEYMVICYGITFTYIKCSNILMGGVRGKRDGPPFSRLFPPAHKTSATR